MVPPESTDLEDDYTNQSVANETKPFTDKAGVDDESKEEITIDKSQPQSAAKKKRNKKRKTSNSTLSIVQPLAEHSTITASSSSVTENAAEKGRTIDFSYEKAIDPRQIEHIKV